MWPTGPSVLKSSRNISWASDDGVPKTPEWAEEITGVQARVTRALAREWASKRTMLGAGAHGSMGGACKAAYAHEWARLMVLLVGACRAWESRGSICGATTVGGTPRHVL